jgi:hypothetical protein
LNPHERSPAAAEASAPASGIAAGWASYEAMALPPQASAVQREECRLAFYGGASTLFYSIMKSLDAGDEPTEADIARMDSIHAEIDQFARTFDAEVAKRRQPEAAAAAQEGGTNARSTVPPFAPPASEHQLGDAPIEAEYTAKMNAIAAALDKTFNGQVGGEGRETGFVLMVFKFGDEGRCNYISNGADRQDVVTLFKEMIARFQGQPALKGTA